MVGEGRDAIFANVPELEVATQEMADLRLVGSLGRWRVQVNHCNNEGPPAWVGATALGPDAEVWRDSSGCMDGKGAFAINI